MTKLPKDKRDKLILVCMVTLFALIGIGVGMIRPQYASIGSLKADTNNKRQTLQQMKQAVSNSDTTVSELQDASDALSQAEQDMAVGDPNGWIYDTVRKFKSEYKIDMTIASATTIGDVDLLPDVPFKQLKVTVTGTAYYHDLGRFIADFENDYPHGRICNLSLAPSGGSGDSAEKLFFRMDLIVLVKPSET